MNGKIYQHKTKIMKVVKKNPHTKNDVRNKNYNKWLHEEIRKVKDESEIILLSIL